MKTDNIKLIVAEDHAIVRDGLIQMITTYSNNINIVADAENGKTLIELIDRFSPDIVILDINMPVMNGNEVLKVLSQRSKKPKVIVLSSTYSHFLVAHTIFNGASAYLPKEIDIHKLLLAVERVYTDGFYFNDSISKRVMEGIKAGKKPYYTIYEERFSEKELTVLRLLCEDKTYDEIAAIMGISGNTVKYHKKNIMEKSNTDSLLQLLRYAIKQGIVG